MKVLSRFFLLCFFNRVRRRHSRPPTTNKESVGVEELSLAVGRDLP